MSIYTSLQEYFRSHRKYKGTKSVDIKSTNEANYQNEKDCWRIKSRRKFTEDELASVKSAHVVPSQYGKTVCFMLARGGQSFIPLSKNSTLLVGDNVDVSNLELLILEKDGEANIMRVEYINNHSGCKGTKSVDIKSTNEANYQNEKDCWRIKSRRKFTEDELASVKSAHVVPSQYGKTVCFMLARGGQSFIPLSKNSTLLVGDNVDVSNLELLILEKDGEADIMRVEI